MEKSEKDLVGALLFLLNNDAAGFITGICLPACLWTAASRHIPACNKCCEIYKTTPVSRCSSPAGQGWFFQRG